MPIVHCNKDCAIRDDLKAKVLKLEGALKILKTSSRESSVLVIHAHRREEDLKKQLSEARLDTRRLKLWKK